MNYKETINLDFNYPQIHNLTGSNLIAMNTDGAAIYNVLRTSTATWVGINELDGRPRTTFQVRHIASDDVHLCLDNDMLYLAKESEAIGLIAEIYPYRKTDGRAGAAIQLPVHPADPYAVITATLGIIRNMSVWQALQHCSDYYNVASYDTDGEPADFDRLLLDEEIGAAVDIIDAGNAVYALTPTHAYPLSRSFGQTGAGFSISEHDVAYSIGGGWTGSALLVADAAGQVVVFTEQEAADVMPALQKGTRQFRTRGQRKRAETMAWMRQEPSGLMVRAHGWLTLRHSTVESAQIQRRLGLEDTVELFTLILEYPRTDLLINDYLFRWDSEDAPAHRPSEAYQIKGWNVWSGGVQHLYCVRVKWDGEADTLTGAHSPLRLRR